VVARARSDIERIRYARAHALLCVRMCGCASERVGVRSNVRMRAYVCAYALMCARAGACARACDFRHPCRYVRAVHARTPIRA
jgi:hypothetical protein